MSYLPYISDEDFTLAVKKVINITNNAEKKAENDPFRNVIDPFSAIFDAMLNKITLTDWITGIEKRRQVQKTMQNAIGDFHEEIIGAIEGWEKLPTGDGIDVVCRSKQIVAEIKNKHNTMKGDTKQKIYDVLKEEIESNYLGYTGYAVQIIPSKKNPYDLPYTPSYRGTRRPESDSIRMIDGKSFYAIATGIDNALFLLYDALPKVIGDILGGDNTSFKNDSLYLEFFNRAYFNQAQ